MSIKLENCEVMGWEPAIRGMRNAMNSWEKSDTRSGCIHGICGTCGFNINWCGCTPRLIIGPNDRELMMKLRKAGTDHRKYMRMIVVYVDIIAPLYWWKEFDTYKVGTVSNSCSTMHKIHDKEFTLEDFSCEKLSNDVFDPKGAIALDEGFHVTPLEVLEWVIEMLNMNRRLYNETKEKKYWDAMIQLLPSSYNQRRTIEMNYEVLANMYKSRRHHKLDEWHKLCDWIETLPYSEIITGDKKEP